MGALKKLFPLSFKSNSVSSFIISVVLYIIVLLSADFVFGLFTNIAVIGIIFRVIGYLVYFYNVIGIVLSILVFIKVIK